jgi:hypothetical protein
MDKSKYFEKKKEIISIFPPPFLGTNLADSFAKNTWFSLILQVNSMTDSFHHSVSPFDGKDKLLELTMEDFTQNAKISRQSPPPYNSDPRNISGRISKGYHMIIKRGTNRMVLLRFLIAKLRFSAEGISLEEYLLLYHLYFDLSESKDPNFQEKYKVFLKKVQENLEFLNENRIFPIILGEKERQYLDEIFSNDIPKAREYFGLAGQRDIRDSFRLILHDAIEPKRFAPKKVIGVGYKDKGTCRNIAFDGSPSWKEIATVFSYQERKAEETKILNSSQEAVEP